MFAFMFRTPPRSKHKLIYASILSSVLLMQGCTQLPESKDDQNAFEQLPTKNLSESSEQIALTSKAPIANVKITEKNISSKEIIKEHYPVIWPEIQGQFHLATHHMGQYDSFIEFYQQRNKHLVASFNRSEPYLFYIKNEVAKRKMPMELALLPLVESGFAPKARSNKKAVGLWQFIPSTGKMYGLQQDWWFDGRSDIVKSTDAALTFLQDLHKQNNGDWLLALASYNAGYGAVLKARKRFFKKHPEIPETSTLDYWQLRPYLPKETANYVPKLLAVAHMVQYAQEYELDLHPVNNEPHFGVYPIDKQISLPEVALALNLPVEALYQLNPGYLRAATPPSEGFHILLPENKLTEFDTLFQTQPERFVVNWQRHKIKSGDVLGSIAKRYGTSIKAIKSLNNLSSNRIRINQTLLIPIAVANSSSNNNHQTADKGTTVTAILAENSTTVKHPQTTFATAQSVIDYKVKAGDSLWKIAQQHNISLEQLLQTNQLQAKTTLKLNQTLKIVIDRSQNTPKDSIQKQAKQTPRLVEHKVAKGEVLSIIAENYGVSLSQLKQWNALSSSVIKPGQTLKLWLRANTPKHKEYLVKHGDNLWVIAKSHQINLQKLAQYNSINAKIPLKPGQVLKIPYNS